MFGTKFIFKQVPDKSYAYVLTVLILRFSLPFLSLIYLCPYIESAICTEHLHTHTHIYTRIDLHSCKGLMTEQADI